MDNEVKKIEPKPPSVGKRTAIFTMIATSVIELIRLIFDNWDTLFP